MQAVKDVAEKGRICILDIEMEVGTYIGIGFFFFFFLVFVHPSVFSSLFSTLPTHLKTCVTEKLIMLCY